MIFSPDLQAEFLEMELLGQMDYWLDEEESAEEKNEVEQIDNLEALPF